MDVCGPLEIPGGPPVVHLNHVENLWTNSPDSRIGILAAECLRI